MRSSSSSSPAVLRGCAASPAPPPSSWRRRSSSSRSRATPRATPFQSALKTQLAYVVTGDKETDETSLAGLRGLTAFIADRTALEPGEPVGVDVGRDELAFHALLYWPIVAGLPPPPQAAMAKVDAFMKSGGTIIFDTRDALQQSAGLASTPAGETLQKLLSTLDIPELEPVPRDHVLTKTFYLMEKFPGRYEAGETWVEALPVEDAADRRPPGAGRRRRLADHHHRQRPRRRLGRRRRPQAALPAGAGRRRASASWPIAAASTS